MPSSSSIPSSTSTVPNGGSSHKSNIPALAPGTAAGNVTARRVVDSNGGVGRVTGMVPTLPVSVKVEAATANIVPGDETLHEDSQVRIVRVWAQARGVGAVCPSPLYCDTGTAG